MDIDESIDGICKDAAGRCTLRLIKSADISNITRENIDTLNVVKKSENNNNNEIKLNKTTVISSNKSYTQWSFGANSNLMILILFNVYCKINNKID